MTALTTKELQYIDDLLSDHLTFLTEEFEDGNKDVEKDQILVSNLLDKIQLELSST